MRPFALLLMTVSIGQFEVVHAQDPLLAQTIEVAWGDQTVSLRFSELAKINEKMGLTELSVQDPVYQKQKTYIGFPLKKVIDFASTKFSDLNLNHFNGEILFHCKDGYAPTATLEQIQKNDALLAIQEKGRTSESPWEPLVQNGKSIEFKPAYIVWSNHKKNQHLPWPYQVVKLRFIDFNKTYNRILPHDKSVRSSVYQGFLVFKNNCLKCHKLNGQGGEMGPELNFPKNITEYWKEGELLKYIRNPQDYRVPNRMSPVKLSDPEGRHLLRYLKYMKNHKEH